MPFWSKGLAYINFSFKVRRLLPRPSWRRGWRLSTRLHRRRWGQQGCAATEKFKIRKLCSCKQTNDSCMPVNLTHFPELYNHTCTTALHNSSQKAKLIYTCYTWYTLWGAWVTVLTPVVSSPLRCFARVLKFMLYFINPLFNFSCTFLWLCSFVFLWHCEPFKRKAPL